MDPENNLSNTSSSEEKIILKNGNDNTGIGVFASHLYYATSFIASAILTLMFIGQHVVTLGIFLGKTGEALVHVAGLSALASVAFCIVSTLSNRKKANSPSKERPHNSGVNNWSKGGVVTRVIGYIAIITSSLISFLYIMITLHYNISFNFVLVAIATSAINTYILSKFILVFIIGKSQRRKRYQDSNSANLNVPSPTGSGNVASQTTTSVRDDNERPRRQVTWFDLVISRRALGCLTAFICIAGFAFWFLYDPMELLSSSEQAAVAVYYQNHNALITTGYVPDEVVKFRAFRWMSSASSWVFWIGLLIYVIYVILFIKLANTKQCPSCFKRFDARALICPYCRSGIASPVPRAPLESPIEPHPSSTHDESSVKTCPMCAETIKAAAKKCKHCGHLFEQQT